MTGKFGPEALTADDYTSQVTVGRPVRMLLDAPMTGGPNIFEGMQAGLLDSESLNDPSLKTFGELPRYQGKFAEPQ